MSVSRRDGAWPRILAAAVAMAAWTALPVAHAESAAPRERISINSDWRFTRDDPASAADRLAYPKVKAWMMSTGEDLVENAGAGKHPRPEGNIGEDVAYTRPDFDDSRWRRLDLPHDWGIEGPFDIRAPSGTGQASLPARRLVQEAPGHPRIRPGQTILPRYRRRNVLFERLAQRALRRRMGVRLLVLPRGPQSVHPPRGDNVLAIRLDNPDQSSRWYPGGGIYRNVWLVTTTTVHIGHHGVVITSPNVTSTKAEIDLGITIDNDSASDAKPVVSVRIFGLDAEDRRGPDAAAIVDAFPLPVPAGRSATAAATTSILNPRPGTRERRTGTSPWSASKPEADRWIPARFPSAFGRSISTPRKASC